ncbi:Transcription initiation factor IIE subunit beta [Komagataella phaffii CBS 7435]|uniref:Transcription initiation factor IIE subunit beta n=3 Tax=Komagataella TaxID=460517 RepID=C4R5F1_KOMPG|nr:TFIIE small subunit, involved in RNA polymerase II transcription initiation [Komagataella phaffii GS115]ANZ77214.1 BA75_03804T0 [Komagataella pastoris]AOA63910.1 GQ67_03832T0 [Komagataella phaffii]KAI0463549.1 hypothetical protein LJB42_002549 [Komagataella kurtzmanii]CAH2449432.1 Transcription initiation factor IIE subunit beta [Komagataella phaffii CBS 7435]AOA69119.1 GQ68_03805T0 [Komagataella phaffii GS115]
MDDRLSAQLNAFKNRIRNTANIPAPKRIVQLDPEPKVSPLRQHQQTIKKEQQRSEIEEELQHESTRSLANISGSHLSTQLHLAVEYIKKQDKEVSINELQRHMSMDISKTLLPLLKNIDRIRYDPDRHTLEYMSLHNIRSAEDLLNYLRIQATFKGILVKELKDGWSGCLAAIAELEEEQKIIVLRTKKENVPRLVWANKGGKLGQIDDDFIEMWSKVKLPDAGNLQEELINNGLKPTSVDPSSIKRKVMHSQENKQKKPRRGKITNTHMKGILKDYSGRV